MCSINPKYQKTFTFEVFTAHGTKREFDKNVYKKIKRLLDLELELNRDCKLRWILREGK